MPFKMCEGGFEVGAGSGQLFIKSMKYLLDVESASMCKCIYEHSK